MIEALVCSQNWLRSKLLSTEMVMTQRWLTMLKVINTIHVSFYYSLRNLFFYLQIPFIGLNCDCNYLFLFNSL
jgi:hypothetical protein